MSPGPRTVPAGPVPRAESWRPRCPVAPVRPFGTDDEAVALAAASPYGLAVGIVTADPARGLDLAGRIPTGIVHVKDQTVNHEAVAPFGGVAASGTGARFGGEANLDAFTELR